MSKQQIDNYSPITCIGKGAISSVFLVEEKKTDELYAMKVIMKSDIKQKIGDTKVKLKLEKLQHPFILEFKSYFSANQSIIFITKFMRGGDLFYQLQQEKDLRHFTESRAKFYFCEIALALSYQHEKGFINRDLKMFFKLENVLLDEEGHIALTDYGLCRLLQNQSKESQFLGTPEYLGICLQIQLQKLLNYQMVNHILKPVIDEVQEYEMLIGIPPFYHSNQYVMFQLILEAGLQFPKSIEITKECQHFISMLLAKNPNDRLGKDGFDEIQGHPWFANVQWERFQKKEVKPEFLPNFGGTIYQNFDRSITESRIFFNFFSLFEIAKFQEFFDKLRG